MRHHPKILWKSCATEPMCCIQHRMAIILLTMDIHMEIWWIVAIPPLKMRIVIYLMPKRISIIC